MTGYSPDNGKPQTIRYAEKVNFQVVEKIKGWG